MSSRAFWVWLLVRLLEAACLHCIASQHTESWKLAVFAECTDVNCCKIHLLKRISTFRLSANEYQLSDNAHAHGVCTDVKPYMMFSYQTPCL